MPLGVYLSGTMKGSKARFPPLALDLFRTLLAGKETSTNLLNSSLRLKSTSRESWFSTSANTKKNKSAASGGVSSDSTSSSLPSTPANNKFTVDNPYSTETVAEIPLSSLAQFKSLAAGSRLTQQSWRKVKLEDRVKLFDHFIQYFKDNKEAVAKEISLQMGKPMQQALGEINGLEERTKAFQSMALNSSVLRTETITNDAKFLKQIHKEPVGVVMSLAPWNYPLLTAVNSIVPAILSGNTVLLSHGPRTPLTSTRFKLAIKYAVDKLGVKLPSQNGVLEEFFVSYDVLKKGIESGACDFVSFTGSTVVGKDIYKSVANVSGPKLVDCTLELGGNDACYIAKENDEATFKNAVETAVDASFYNAGQSCCGIERAYIHEAHYDRFLSEAVKLVKSLYVLGNPLDKETTMGPVARGDHVRHLARLVRDATDKGAKVLCGGHAINDKLGNGRFFEPTILSECTSDMLCMQLEIFGPILACQKVKSDDEAIKLINESSLGLTCALFTNDTNKMDKFVEQVDVGTVFMNRADYLDPYMPWQGRKDTGKGCSLSVYGFNGYYRLKNRHIKCIK